MSISNAWAAPIPNVTLADVPNEVLVGEDFSFDVTFKNAGNAEGYGPYIELYLPAWGADGTALALKCDGIRYVGAEALFTSPSSLTLTPEPPTPIPSISCPPSSYVHPFGPSAAALSSLAASHQLVVIKLPLGSYEPGQPPIRVKVKAHVSDYADTGVPLKIYARGGFQYGASPTGSAIEMNGSVNKTTTPTVFSISKKFLGPENEIAAGPNFVGGYEIPVDIADGQTIDHLTVSDQLPPAMQYEGGLSVLINTIPAAPGASCGSGVDYTVSPPSSSGGVLSLKFCHSITGTTHSKDVAIYYNFSITQDGLNKNCKPFKNINKVKAKGMWLPLDPRDQPGITVKAKFKANHPPLLSKCMAIQKSVLPLGDPKPDDTLNYTLNFQVSDYKTIGKLIATDLLSDGQTLVAGSASMTVKDRTGVLMAPVTSTNISITPHAHFKCKTDMGEVIKSGSAIQFDISNWMGAQSGASTRQLAGILTGGLAASPTSPVPAIGTITFSTKVADSFSYNPPGTATPVVKDDPLCNAVTIEGRVYNYKPDINVIPPISKVKAKDNSGTLKRIASDTIRKTVYAVVRSTNEICGPNSTPCVLPPAAPEVRAGDVVTFRIEKAIPSGDADHLMVTDWLPQPVFSVAGMTFNAASCVLPSSGMACYGPTNTPVSAAAPDPAFSTNPGVNSLIFNYGSFNNPANTPRKIDLLFSVTVSTAPFADGLYLTNEALETEQNTFDVGFGQVAIAQVNLREPALSITKGVVATDNPNGVFTPAGFPSTPFTAPSAGGCPRFAAPITSGGMINSNLSGVDAGDQVTFAIAVENSGGSPAYDINLNDLYPVGQHEDPTCFKPYFDKHNFCVTDGAGTPLPFSISAPSGSGSASIHLTAPLPASGTPPPGSNVAVITFNGTLLDKEQFMAGCCDNMAELTHYTSIPDGQDFVQAGIGGPFEDVAKVCSGPKPYGKCIQSTSEAHTTPPNAAQSGSVDAAIGEIVRYRLITTIPEGTTQDFQIKDLLPAGLTYAGNPSITFVAGGIVTTTPASNWTNLHGDESTYGTCPSKNKLPVSVVDVGGAPFNIGAGTDPIFFVGSGSSNPWPPVFDIYNPDNDTNQELAIIEFNALVDNMNPPNINAAVLPNKFEVSYKDSHSNPSQTITQTSGAVNVKVVEPALAITKTLQTPTAANMLTFNLHVTNTSGTDAFDVVVSDALPACLTGLSNVNVTPSAGASNVSTPTQLNVTIVKLLAGQSVDVSYQIHQGCAADQCPVVNTATVTWTSLPGPNGTISNPTGSSTPGASGANNGERNGTGANPPNSYRASASLDICGKVCVEKKESGGGLLGGWEVNVGSTPVTPITTSASGPVCINMPAGVYSLSEQLQGGWSPVSPAGGTTTATVLPGSSGNFTFVNKKIPAEHYKCYDVDPDTFTPLSVTLRDQFGISTHKVVKTKYICTPVDKNGEGIVDPIRHQVCYEISPQNSPDKLVSINNQFGSQTFTVKKERLLCVPSTKTLISRICGYKFNDLNGNGVWDHQPPTEPALAGWTINVDGSAAHAVTGQNGHYCIDVPVGQHTVSEVLQPGWVQTAPLPVPPGTVSVTTAPGQTINNINFGNQQAAQPCCLSVVKKALDTPWQVGGQGAFSLTVENTCNQSLSVPLDSILVQDMLNPTFGFVSASGSGWSNCTPATSTCQYATGSTIPAGFVSNPLVVTVNVAAGASSTIQNCARASIPQGGVVPQWCNETCIDVPVQQNQPGEICGYKFNDLDGNGTWDQPQEPGLQNWNITVTDAAGQSVGIATTDASGKYCISVPESTTPYAVTEVVQSGWSQTAPTTPHSVPVPSGQTVNGINFGNQAQPPQCCLHVNKTALNMPWQAGGQGVFTLQVVNTCGPIDLLPAYPNIDVIDNLNPAFSNPSATGTNWNCSTGGCSYTPTSLILPPGPLPTLTVSVDVDSNAGSTIQNCARAGRHPINAAAPQFCPETCIQVPVQPNQPGQICGYKFNDLDGNGTWDQPQEPGLQNWNITVTDAAGQSVGIATTDASGRYCIPVPASSTPYSVTESMQSSWTQTAPATPHSVTVVSGQTVDNINFGNQETTPSCCMQVTKTALNTPWQAGGQGSFTLEVRNVCNTTISGDQLFPEIEVQDLLDSSFTLSSVVAGPWSCVGGTGGYPLQCGYSPFSLAPGASLPVITVTVDIGPNASGIIQNTATTNLTGAVLGPTLCTDTIPVSISPLLNTAPHISMEKRHSPSSFSTGNKGAFAIKVKNKGPKLEKGMLTIVDHMPPGLSVKTGSFRAGSWACKGGEISNSGQDVTCTYNRKLGKKGRAKLNLNVRIAPKGTFPADVKEVENCAAVSVKGGVAGAAPASKVCDKVKIKQIGRSRDVLKDLAPLGGLLMQIPRGGGGAKTRAPTGAAGP